MKSNFRKASLFVAGIGLVVMMAVPSAQRRSDNGSQGTPTATNTILKNPDAYYGKVVTISAGVEQILSKTAFLVDQRKAFGATEAKAIGTPILVIAPYMTGTVEQKNYLLVRGELVKFSPAALARVSADYKLDLAPDVAATYEGKPVLLATSVINSTFAELAAKPAPPKNAEK